MADFRVPPASGGNLQEGGETFYDPIVRLEPSRAVVYDLNIEPDHNYYTTTVVIPIAWSELTNRVYSCLPYTQEDYLCADENS
jgi:hypothetical protein